MDGGHCHRARAAGHSDGGSEFMWDLIEVWEAKVAGLTRAEFLEDG